MGMVCIVWVSCSTCIVIHCSSRVRKGQLPWVTERIGSVVSSIFF